LKKKENKPQFNDFKDLKFFLGDRALNHFSIIFVNQAIY